MLFLSSAYPASVLWMRCAPYVAAHFFGLEGREEQWVLTTIMDKIHMHTESKAVLALD